MAGWHVTANDIRTWTSTDKRRAEEILPLLIKRLILASCNPQKIEFGTGDAIAVGGWDGILEVEEGNAFVPTGKSGWEMGTNEQVKGKADSDYSKRLKNPTPFSLSDTTFIFATTRLWSRKDNWVRFKQNTGKWKDVKGINAEVLQDWLESCPSVHRWFSELVEKRHGSLWDIDQAWDRFSNQTGVKITSGFLLHSREEISSSLLAQLSGAASCIRVSAESAKEAYGFVLSSLLSDESFLARTLIVRAQEDWDNLCNCHNSLILVPWGFIPDGVGLATKNGHFVITPLDVKNKRGEGILLPHQIRLDRQEALKKLELTDDQVTTLFSDTKGFFEPLIRHDLMNPIDLATPTWPDDFSTDLLFAILIASEFDSSNSRDWEILESLSGAKKAELEQFLESLSGQDDPPIRKVGSLWQVISKMDFWLIVAPRINLPVLSRLLEVSTPVLSDEDPSFDLDPSDRFMSSVSPLYSTRLKRGIADSLALIANHGDEYSEQLNGSFPSNSIAKWACSFFDDNNSAKFWYSLSNCTELLAEAVPKEFLDAVDKSTKEENSAVEQLLTNEGDGFLGGGCYHSNLLWALEQFSWSKQFFTRACKCLARMSQIDHGGKFNNRPFNSLVDMFLGWVNNTILTHDERLQVLEDVIMVQFPDIGWKLSNQLLLNRTRVSSGVSKSSYREWAPRYYERAVPRVDHIKYVIEIVDLMIKSIPEKGASALVDLIDNFDSYSEDQREKILELILNFDVQRLNETERHQVLNKLRNKICHHREFPNADCVWDEGFLSKLENVYKHLNFDDLLNESLYLFNDHRPSLINPLNRKDTNYEDRTDAIEALRIERINSLFEEQSLGGITELISRSSETWIVANSVCKSKARDICIRSSVEWISLPVESSSSRFAKGVIGNLACDDIGAALQLFEEEKDNWNEDVIAQFLLSLPLNRTSFEAIQKSDEAVQTSYWKELNVFDLPDHEEGLVASIASCFLKHNRPAAAIKTISQLFYSKKKELIDGNLLADILVDIIRSEDSIEEETLPNVYHEINKAIKYVQDSSDVDNQIKLQIEWGFLSLSDRAYSPTNLANEVANDPMFFCQLICWLYKRSDDKPEDDEAIDPKQREIRASGAWYLLNKLEVIPGSNGTEVDDKRLLDWILKVRNKLQQQSRLEVGDTKIGTLLSTCSAGDDGVWPLKAVRKVIEIIDSQSLFDGMGTGKMNSRGVTTRHPYAGGKQERDLAAKYTKYAEDVELAFPRTAEMLRSLAQSYHSQADDMDRRVEAGK